jgi:hypothetical protein
MALAPRESFIWNYSTVPNNALSRARACAFSPAGQGNADLYTTRTELGALL